MMTSPVAGIDPHQDTYTIGIVDPNGVELAHQTFPTSAAGYLDGIELLSSHAVEQVGIEGSASWGAHAAIALTAAGFDCREVPPQRSAAQRRARRLDKTDAVDAVAAARALLAEPSLGPVQTLEIYDPLVAKIEAVVEHRRMLVTVRTLVLHYVQDQLSKLPVEIRDQLSTTGMIESRLRQLEAINLTCRRWRASIASAGYSRSLNKTEQPAARSAGSNATSTVCSTSTAPLCVTNLASARSPQQR